MGFDGDETRPVLSSIWNSPCLVPLLLKAYLNLSFREVIAGIFSRRAPRANCQRKNMGHPAHGHGAEIETCWASRIGTVYFAYGDLVTADLSGL